MKSEFLEIPERYSKFKKNGRLMKLSTPFLYCEQLNLIYPKIRKIFLENSACMLKNVLPLT